MKELPHQWGPDANYWFMDRSMLEIWRSHPEQNYPGDILIDMKVLQNAGPGVEIYWGLAKCGSGTTTMTVPEYGTRDSILKHMHERCHRVYDVSYEKHMAHPDYATSFARRRPIVEIRNTAKELAQCSSRSR